MLLPIDFPYPVFALLIFGNGVGSGLFAAPNTAAIMSSVPAHNRGAASGMRSTFQNSGMSLSIGVFFSLMIAGLANTLPRTLTTGLTAQGVPLATATKIAHLPPVSVVFSALLGYNPMQNLLGPTGVLSRLPAANAATLTGKQFFPTLISGPFHHGLMIVFTAAAVMSVIGAAVSMLRGKPASWTSWTSWTSWMSQRAGSWLVSRPRRRSRQARRTEPFGKMYRGLSQTRLIDVPRYEYRCRACGDTFELTRPMSESAAPCSCPQGHDDTVKLLSTVAVSGVASRPAGGSMAPGAGGGGCCGGACGCG